ncbi:DUF6440 family protein [Paenibacillus cremeus]|uniref:DUF6440 domain-containing protein n=1 Tax=Paenibacillus cremeus TaxID=2163881 RepID=A0A559KCI7_9BACL|nr:DUF6440 family protein [Paenibacillus cremeus]TVY09847.1 hypothetical protein FPZ49_10770 [Paenibacillus cremeus]
MKKIQNKLLLFVSLMLLLSSCGHARAKEDVQSRFTREQVQNSLIDGYYYIVTDHETGCKYLMKDNKDSSGITALLDKDGKPVGCGK